MIQVLNEGIACDLVGVKRTGKSTIFNQVVKKLVEEKGVNPFLTLIINFEDPRLAEINGGFLICLTYTRKNQSKR